MNYREWWYNFRRDPNNIGAMFLGIALFIVIMVVFYLLKG